MSNTLIEPAERGNSEVLQETVEASSSTTHFETVFSKDSVTQNENDLLSAEGQTVHGLQEEETKSETQDLTEIFNLVRHAYQIAKGYHKRREARKASAEAIQESLQTEDKNSLKKWKKIMEKLELARAQSPLARRRLLMKTVVPRIGKGIAHENIWLMLEGEHGLEFRDEQHRYGANLKVYFEEYKGPDTNEDFFYWLDKDGDELKDYEVIIKDGLLIYDKSGVPVHTNPISHSFKLEENSVLGVQETNNLENQKDEQYEIDDIDEKSSIKSHGSAETDVVKEKWIYVQGRDNKLYVNRKIKGHFHHSSFFGGEPVHAAGGISVDHGKLLEITPKSGHYKPHAEHFDKLKEQLQKGGIDFKNVAVVKCDKKRSKKSIEKKSENFLKDYEWLKKIGLAYWDTDIDEEGNNKNQVVNVVVSKDFKPEETRDVETVSISALITATTTTSSSKKSPNEPDKTRLVSKDLIEVKQTKNIETTSISALIKTTTPTTTTTTTTTTVSKRSHNEPESSLATTSTTSVDLLIKAHPKENNGHCLCKRLLDKFLKMFH